MGKKPTKEEEPNMVPLNVNIPADLARRVGLAKAETRRPIKELVAEWIEHGLSSLADEKGMSHLKPPKQTPSDRRAK